MQKMKEVSKEYRKNVNKNDEIRERIRRAILKLTKVGLLGGLVG